MSETNGKATRLNIGAGATVIEGFTPIDRRIGLEAFPLPQYESDSVEEIRCSHLLEHFSYADALAAIAEWYRVLKPGARIRLAVPGFEKIIRLSGDDPAWRFYLMGGQTDENDYHRSVWSEELMFQLLKQAGFERIGYWQCVDTDTAQLPVSLNVEAYKPNPQMELNVCAVMSIPRVGFNDNWGSVMEGLGPLRIPVKRFSGVFWGQCMQRAFNECVETGVDWILTIDYDTMFTARHVDKLLGTLGQNPHIDALAALQCRRGMKYPLMTKGGTTKASLDGSPVQATTAHFGLTLIRVDALKQVPKPWFYAQPDEKAEWGDARFDDDIWFWHQWRLAGKTVFVDPTCSVGHLELMVAWYDDREMDIEGREMTPKHIYVPEWRDIHDEKKKVKADDGANVEGLGEASGGDGSGFVQTDRTKFDLGKRVLSTFRNSDDGNGNGAADGSGGNGNAETQGATA